MDKGIFKDFCGAASLPVSAFRAGYNMMAQGATPAAQATASISGVSGYNPSQP